MTDVLERNLAKIKRLEELLESARGVADQRRLEIERLRTEIALPRCRACSDAMPTVCNGCFVEAL